jgi:hypothetical protein
MLLEYTVSNLEVLLALARKGPCCIEHLDLLQNSAHWILHWLQHSRCKSSFQGNRMYLKQYFFFYQKVRIKHF